MKLKRNDEVIVVRGKDKDKKGKIDKVYTKGNKVLVPGVNLYKRHKKSRMQNKPSEIIEITLPMNASSVELICPNCHKQTKIGYKFENKEKIRVCKKCNKKI